MNSPGAYSMDKFFCIPELVRITCSFGEPEDNAHLALTCRTLFAYAIPAAWTSVSGVCQLLLLLNNSTSSIREDSKGEFCELKLPEILNEAHTTRFNFYAPFVTSLDIFKYQDDRISILNPQPLIQFANVRELLPNLKCLELTTDWKRRFNCVFWTNIFACRSLLEVNIPSSSDCEREFISDAAASGLTSTLQRRSSHIQKLTFFSHRNSPVDEEENLLDRNFNHDRTPMHTFLPQFTSLTTINGSIGLLESPALLALGSLPELKHLAVLYPMEDDIPEPDPTVLPPGSFPKLDTLTLTNVVEHTADFIWTMPALVTRLQSLTINFQPPYNQEDETGWILQSLIPLICTHSPHIKEMVLEFNYTIFDAKEERYICNFSETAFDALAKLKLTHLEVLHARMVGEALTDRLVNTWPQIEVLRWTHQLVKVPQLSQFTKRLPKLKRLALSIDLNSFPDKCDANALVDITHPELRAIESDFHGLGSLDGISAAELFVYLRKLVPHAKLEPLEAAYLESDLSLERKLDLACAMSINLMEMYIDIIRTHQAKEPDPASGGCLPTADESTSTQAAAIWNAVRNYTRDIILAKRDKLEQTASEQTSH
ncbi:unnamed protein product [Rhizoctonia solani]|uniref:Uncharacterized protein n=1 Tax=Rhizoctonia solani TaxID=456999 RepID=A0A8H3CD37_9AGAM|nr:unnamed protein product [Rhizoctonia solani]